MLFPSILAATGHRPNKLGGYGTATNERLVRLAHGYLEPRRKELDHVISGMAMGWDLAWAEAAIKLRIPVMGAIPFEGYTYKWSRDEIDRCNHLLSKCVGVYVVAQHYEEGVYQRRNEWMVDHAEALVALWDGSPGGTANCVRYAEKVGMHVTNLWSNYNG